MEDEGPDDGVGGWGGTEELSQNHLSRDLQKSGADGRCVF